MGDQPEKTAQQPDEELREPDEALPESEEELDPDAEDVAIGTVRRTVRHPSAVSSPLPFGLSGDDDGEQQP